MDTTTTAFRTAANGVNKKIIRPTTNGLQSAANGVNAIIVRPTTSGLNSAANGVNSIIIRPTTTGLQSAANGMNESIIRPTKSGVQSAANGVNDIIIRPTTNGLQSAANGMNKKIIRPTTTGLQSAANGMNEIIIRPTKSGLNSAANGMNSIIVRPTTNGFKAVVSKVVEPMVKDPIFKLASVMISDKNLKDADNGRSDSFSHPNSSLSDLEELEYDDDDDEESVLESALQYLIADGNVNSEILETALKDMYSERVASVHDEAESDQDRFAIGSDLDASSLLMHEFGLLVADREVLEKVQEAIDECIIPRIEFKCADISTLRASEIAKVICFADLYKRTLADKRMKVPKEKLAFFQELSTEYIRRAVHDQMRKGIEKSRLLVEEEGPRQCKNGNLVTGNPEDISYMMDMQLKVATDNLPAEFHSEVLVACYHEIYNNLAMVVKEELVTKWKDISIDRLCAVVNDTKTLIEMCEEFSASFLDSNNSEHQEEGDSLIDALVVLSMESARSVGKRIVHGLEEPDPILTSVGTLSWESRSESFVTQSTKLLQDYLIDIEYWINDEGYYFPMSLRCSFDMILQSYVDSFFSKTMAYGIKDPVAVSKVLESDWCEFTTFFCTKDAQAKYLGKAGHHSGEEATHRLGVILALSSIMNTNTPPEKLKQEVATLLRLFGIEKGIIGLLHLAGLRQKRFRVNTVETASWHNVTKQVVDELAQEQQTQQASSISRPTKPAFSLPNLRASKYIKRVRKSKDHKANEELDKSLASVGLDQPSRWQDLRRRASRRRHQPNSDDTLVTNKSKNKEGELWKEDQGE